MKIVSIIEETEKLKFIEEAAEHFAKHPEHSSYTSENIVEGCWFAVRWGLGNDCILAFKVGSEPELFEQVIKEK